MSKIEQAMVGAVIPIYNPDARFIDVLVALGSQMHPIKELVIVDSSPSEWMPQSELDSILPGVSVRLIKIEPSEFDHGRTRNLGVRNLSIVDYILFLTQDAIMLTNCVEQLIRFSQENDIAATYARQIPHDGASLLESIERDFNYPVQSRVSQGKPETFSDIFFSDVCSLFRLTTFEKANGFPEKVITSEDALIANKFLCAGYRVGYCANAQVKHSHKLTFSETVRRYFDTGVMHTEWKAELPIQSVKGKGLDFVLSSVKTVLRDEPSSLVYLFRSTLGKFVGYYLGRRYRWLGKQLCRRMSAQKAYWGK